MDWDLCHMDRGVTPARPGFAVLRSAGNRDVGIVIAAQAFAACHSPSAYRQTRTAPPQPVSDRRNDSFLTSTSRGGNEGLGGPGAG